MLPSKESVVYAAHVLYCDAYAQEMESQGHRFPSGELTDMIDRLPEADLLPPAHRLIGRIEQAWGAPIGLVFYHMGLTDPRDERDALAALFLGCIGHGVTIEDDYSEALDKARKVLRMELKACPIHAEGLDFWELAMNNSKKSPVDGK